MPQDEPRNAEQETLTLLLRHLKGAIRAIENYLTYLKEKEDAKT